MQCNDCGHELIVEEENGVKFVKPCRNCMNESFQEGKLLGEVIGEAEAHRSRERERPLRSGY